MIDPNFPVIVDAVQNNLQITFRYGSKNTAVEETTDRIVEPWIYGSKNGKESLYGYQVSGGEVGLKRFDMRRVKHVKLTGEKIENHPSKAAVVSKWDSIFAATDIKQEATS